MNPKGYFAHASAVLKCYAPDKNQATPALYHISHHNFNLDILRLYGLVIGTLFRTWSVLTFSLINSIG